MIPIVIDTDPGQDDAVAILLALACADRLDLRAITTVAGNVKLKPATANALRICALAGAPRVPVFAGAHAPILFPLVTAEHVHGDDGLGSADIPPATEAARPGHGVEALIRAARETPGLTICALGPLTNIALALRMAPDIAPLLARIVLMGGARDLGNVTPAAEFNIYVDPHAASIVFGVGVPITMLGLHATQHAVPGPAELAALAAVPTRAAAAVRFWLQAAHPLHDPCVIAWLLWPDLFEGRDCHVDTETAPGANRGRTTIDWHGRLGHAPNAHVVGSIDAPAFFSRLRDALARLP